jgi:hypothetical protein
VFFRKLSWIRLRLRSYQRLILFDLMQLHVFVLHSDTLLPFLKDNVSFFKILSLVKEELPFFLKLNRQDITYYYFNNPG